MRGFTKGMTIGLMVGAGVLYMLNPMSKRDVRCMKRRAARAFHNVGDAADDLYSRIK